MTTKRSMANTARPVVGTERNDTENAKRLIDLHGDDFRWSESGDFFTWTGSFWQKGMCQIIEFAKDVAVDIRKKAALIVSQADREAMWKWARVSADKVRIDAMISMARSDPCIHMVPAGFDSDLYALNCKNGTVDLRTGIVRPHDRDDYITRVIDIDYNPKADHRIWNEFLSDIIHDAASRRFLQKAVGHSLTGAQTHKAMFLPYGPTDTGKSTLFSALGKVFGPYAAETDPDIFMARSFGESASAPNETISNLEGVRFLTASELRKGQPVNVALVKRMTGKEKLQSNRKHQHAYMFAPQYKLWLISNELPRIKDPDDAIMKRLHVIPFTNRVPESKQIKNLDVKLANEESEAILAWAIEGAILCEREGLEDSPEIAAATAAYAASQDTIGEFVDEECVIDASYRVELRILYAAYVDWENNGGNRFPPTKRDFKESLETQGYEVRNATGNKVTVFGLTLESLKP